jgi:hypothetical protein
MTDISRCENDGTLGHPFSVPQDNFTMGKPGAQNYGVNYCKYYSQKIYIDYGYRNVQCDEYPFSSTQEGAAKDKINYSVQGVRKEHN